MNFKKPLSALLASLLIGSSAAVAISALEPHGTGIMCRNWLKNNPDYTFSEAYMESVWYENFVALELGTNQRNNVLAVAISQLGYHEGEVGDYSGKGTSGGNCVEYFRLLVDKNGNNWNNNAAEWCACFVNWCLNQAHIDYASSEIGCWKWVGELKAMNMFKDSAAYGGTYTPKPADMIFFNWNEVNTNSGHIGYVLYTTNDRVYTIEGNADNNVTVRSYALNDRCVIGYGTPPYEEGDVPTIDHSYKDGMPRGQYVLNAGGVSLLKAPDSTTRITRIELGSCVSLLDVQGDYAHVSYDGKEGYIPKSNLYLLAETVGEDTLSYDANGGANAPEATMVPFGQSATVTDAVPTLEGDTFLGWSLAPQNYKVDYKAGDTLTLQGDTTLYAVWEKRSFTLATEALSKGEVAEFERPFTGITNTSALHLAMPESMKFFIDSGDTELSLAKDTDGTWGNAALSFVSTQKSNNPYATLDYAALCADLQLAPTSADTVDYIILRVMDISMYNIYLELFYDCGNGMEKSVSKLLQSSSDWQYVVLDMTEAEGFAGDIQKLRLDWAKTADAEGNTMLLDGIYFAANEAQRDAILEGKYIYPAQPILPPPETEPETQPETIPETEPETLPETFPETLHETEPETTADSETLSETADESAEDSTSESIAMSEADTIAATTADEGGCSSLIGLSGLAALIAAGGALMLARRKEH